MRRGVTLEVHTETHKQAQAFNDMHTKGAEYWGLRWLKVNQWVLLGAHSSWGLIGMESDQALRLVYTSIAWRLCVQLFGIPGSFDGQVEVVGRLETLAETVVQGAMV